MKVLTSVKSVKTHPSLFGALENINSVADLRRVKINDMSV